MRREPYGEAWPRVFFELVFGAVFEGPRADMHKIGSVLDFRALLAQNRGFFLDFSSIFDETSRYAALLFREF